MTIMGLLKSVPQGQTRSLTISVMNDMHTQLITVTSHQ